LSSDIRREMTPLFLSLREEVVNHASDFERVECVEALGLSIETVGIRRSFGSGRVGRGVDHVETLRQVGRRCNTSHELGFYTNRVERESQPSDAC
jgi:hypothetical protein